MGTSFCADPSRNREPGVVRVGVHLPAGPLASEALTGAAKAPHIRAGQTGADNPRTNPRSCKRRLFQIHMRFATRAVFSLGLPIGRRRKTDALHQFIDCHWSRMALTMPGAANRIPPVRSVASFHCSILFHRSMKPPTKESS
jgi:hypothetical protein